MLVAEVEPFLGVGGAGLFQGGRRGRRQCRWCVPPSPRPPRSALSSPPDLAPGPGTFAFLYQPPLIPACPATPARTSVPLPWTRGCRSKAGHCRGSAAVALGNGAHARLSRRRTGPRDRRRHIRGRWDRGDAEPKPSRTCLGRRAVRSDRGGRGAGRVLAVWKLMPPAVMKLSGRRPPRFGSGRASLSGFGGFGSGGVGGCGGDGGGGASC